MRKDYFCSILGKGANAHYYPKLSSNDYFVRMLPFVLLETDCILNDVITMFPL